MIPQLCESEPGSVSAPYQPRGPGFGEIFAIGVVPRRMGIARSRPAWYSKGRMDDHKSESTRTGWTRNDLFLALALAILTGLVFARALSSGFVGYDDPIYVTENEVVLRGLTLDGLLWSLSTFEGSTWLPVTWLSHMTDVSLFGTDPSGHHGTSVLLHAINAALAFLVLKRLTGRRWLALVATLLWALHPLRVESVAWVASRKDLLSASFFLLTLWTWQRWTERPKWGRYALCAVSLALGLAAKQVLVTLPCVLLLLDIWPLERYRVRRWSRLVVEKLPLFALAAAAAIVAQRSQSEAFLLDPVDTALPFGERLTTAIAAYGTYLRQTFAPFDLGVSPPLPTGSTWLMALGVLAVVTALAVWNRRRAPGFLVGWSWFLGVLVPMLGLVRFGQLQAHADRFTYLAHLGLLVGLVFVAVLWMRPGATRFAAGLAVVLALFLAGRSWQQIGVWRDDETLWRHSLALGETSHAYFNLAEERRRAGQLDAAIEHSRRAIELDAKNAKAFGLLGALLAQTGHPQEAVRVLSETTELAPSDVPARANLATLLVKQGRGKEAIPHLVRAVELEPDVPVLRLQLASLLGANGRAGEGADVLAPLALGPGPSPGVLLEHGRLLAGAGRWPESIQSLRAAQKLRPDWRKLLQLLATVQERAGRTQAAARTRARLQALGDGR